MLSGYKTFSAFDSPQKSFGFVCVNSVLDVFAVGKQFKIIQSVIRAVQILMVNFHSIRNRAVKGLPHRTMNGDLGVLPVFARAEPDVMIARYVRLNWTRPAIVHPCLAVLDVKRSCNASIKKTSYRAQRSAASKHSLSGVNLLGAKQFSPRHTLYAPKIADFIKAFIAANWFPNLHTVDIKPIYVGGQ